MPVDLKKLPAAELLPVPPDKSRWLLAIILCIIVGVIAVLSLWPKDIPTRSIWFWFCTLLIPFSVGLAGYIVRLRFYENERDHVLWWNHLHRAQHEELILLGQQAVGVLGMAYITPVASNKLATALLQGANGLQAHYSPAVLATLTTASISPRLTDFSETGYGVRLKPMLANIVRQLQSELTQFTGNLRVQIHHDGTLKDEQVRTLWQQVFPSSLAVSALSVTTESDGMMWVDEWLDRQDESLLLSVEVNLFLQERNLQAESVSALLLGSSAWLDRQKTKPLMWIHRPVVLDDADDSVADVARWGRLTSGISWFFWRTQVKGDVLTATLQAMDKAGYMHDKAGEWVLDDIFGMPGTAAGNITLICACEHAAISGQAQWLIVGDKTTQMAVVRPA